MKKTALITGITGQDGSYLAEFLLEKNYQVVGMISDKYNIGWDNIESFQDKIILEKGDLLDEDSLKKIFAVHKPDEVYNLAGISFIPTSWEKPQLTYDINTLGVLRILQIIRKSYSKTRFYQASSAKIFGDPKNSLQNEETEINPIDPYSISKAAAHFAIGAYRRNFSLFVVSGIMYNHESPRRGPDFVTRKITLGAAKIKLGRENKLQLGNLKALQDWGWAPDYIQAMWLMLQSDKPQDFVIATGKLHSVEDVCRIAFKTLGLDYKKHVSGDKILYRKQESHKLCGDASSARKKLNWRPQTSFEKMIEIMTKIDFNNLKERE